MKKDINIVSENKDQQNLIKTSKNFNKSKKNTLDVITFNSSIKDLEDDKMINILDNQSPFCDFTFRKIAGYDQ